MLQKQALRPQQRQDLVTKVVVGLGPDLRRKVHEGRQCGTKRPSSVGVQRSGSGEVRLQKVTPLVEDLIAAYFLLMSILGLAFLSGD